MAPKWNSQSLVRTAAALMAVVTAILLALGDHPVEYVAADALIIAVLAVGAALPEHRALPVLAFGLAFALGVFTVALGARLADGGPPAALALAVASSLAGAALALRLLVLRPAATASRSDRHQQASRM